MDLKAKLRSRNLSTDAGRLLQILTEVMFQGLHSHDLEIKDIWLIFCM